MNRFPDHEQDYAFGQLMLTLRTAIGLTQSGLAEYLGVSRRAVGEWEAGNSYPKAERLKSLITLAAEEHAFTPGAEKEEVRALWRAAHQKVLIDEVWLASLLQTNQPAYAPTSSTQPGSEVSSPSLTAISIRKPKVDWEDALVVSTFYGREWEQAMLTQWVEEERCRVVSVLGLGGIGKSALAVNLMHTLADRFDTVLWRSVRDAPTCQELVDDCLQILAPDALGATSAGLDQHISLLLEQLRRVRTLLVLDNLESVLDPSGIAGRTRPGYEGYGRLFRRIAETEHSSCLLITSREKPEDLAALEGITSPVRALRLSQLGPKACARLLVESQMHGSESDQNRLIEAYAGNPLALKIVAQTIVDLFNGDIATFLAQGAIIYGDIRQLLAEQFKRLSDVQRSIMLWLAILREPCTLDEILSLRVGPIPRIGLLEGMEGLYRHSLVERGEQNMIGASISKRGSFTLQSVVLEYVTERLISEVSSEIEKGTPVILVEHGFALAQSPEYVRQTQDRLIVEAILQRLMTSYRNQSAVEERLLALLSQMVPLADKEQGYGPANLVVLLLKIRGNLRDLDLSRLALRGVSLQGVEMQGSSLAQASIYDSTFTEPFGPIASVAADITGQYWASTTQDGSVQVWRVEREHGGVPQRIWQVDTDTIWKIAFSSDGQKLVGGGWDGMVKLWDVAEGKLLWSSQLDPDSSYVLNIMFAPDNSMIASACRNALLRLWDVTNSAPPDNIPHPNDVWSVAWRPLERNAGRKELATGDSEGMIYLWQLDGLGSANNVLTFKGHTQQVAGLAFSPDGAVLASAGFDGMLKLWEISTGRLLETHSAHAGPVLRLAWSADGRTIASGGVDKTIWLWDVEKSVYRAVLRGHNGAIRGLAFTHNEAETYETLLSGSDDGTVRQWDIISGHSLRILSGYAVSLGEIDWSPDGTQLVTSCSDSPLAIFDVKGVKAPRLLYGHTGVARSVVWSPDGLLFASTETNNIIRIWNAISGECINILRDPLDENIIFSNVSWSPDGKWLASGTVSRGIRVFDMATRGLRWDNEAVTASICSIITWSPDGTRVAGGTFDGKVYVWDASDGRQLEQLSGPSNVIITVTWSPDGAHLAASGEGFDGGELVVWDAHTWEIVHSTMLPPCALTWNKDGSRLISHTDNSLQWWDVQSLELIQSRDIQQETIVDMKRSPDGRMIASCGQGGAIWLWDIETGEHIRTLRRDRPYERLNITGLKGVTEAQKATLRQLGAIEHDV